MRKISEIIIHFSESSYGDADVIRRWHLNRKRADGSPMFSDIAYHFVICNGVRRFGEAYSDSADGLLQAGRPIEKLGGGVKGHHDETLEVCVVGKTKFTDKQFATLREFIGDQLAANPDIKIVAGHNHFDATDCPFFDWKKWLTDNGLAAYIPKGAKA